MINDAISTAQIILTIPVCFAIILVGLLLVELVRRSCNGDRFVGVDPDQHPHPPLPAVVIDVGFAAAHPPEPAQIRHCTLQQSRDLLPQYSVVFLSYQTYEDIMITSSDQKEAGTAARVGHSECAVCLAEFEAADWCSVLGKCGHVFHAQCAKQWLEKNPSCPVCRTSSLIFSDNVSRSRRLTINRPS
uniref:RING-type domain-containing protein n=1 Tax=Kalanchoe fedtschenkoi TaxID=63787 RepID=A0A7N0TNL1_KALFE